MAVARFTRTRPTVAKPIGHVPLRSRKEPLSQNFEINFKLELAGEGITEAEARGYVQECMRYAAAAFAFKVPHPTEERDVHRRKDNARCGGAEAVTARHLNTI